MNYFFNPITVLSVMLLFINDHYLKSIYHNFWTGKISDFAGVYFLPLFLLQIVSFIPQVKVSLRLLVFCILLTDLFFIGIKVSHEFNTLVVGFLNQLGYPSKIYQDTWDLVALIMNIATYKIAKKYLVQPN